MSGERTPFLGPPPVRAMDCSHCSG